MCWIYHPGDQKQHVTGKTTDCIWLILKYFDYLISLFLFFFQISYYNQASPEVVPYISTDIAGLSSSFYHTFCSCSQYLTNNRLQLASEHETDQAQDTNTDSPTCASVDDSLMVAVSSTKL